MRPSCTLPSEDTVPNRSVGSSGCIRTPDPETLLNLIQSLLDVHPLGLMILDEAGRCNWWNREAELACAAWNQAATGVDSLPVERSEFQVPPALWRACQALLQTSTGSALHRTCDVVANHDQGLVAHVRLEIVQSVPWFPIRIDYRRPRSDRERPVSPQALALLYRLTPREREVAMRLRDGLSTSAIGAALSRSPLTIKSQLKSIYWKLGVQNRARAAALLNR